MSKKIFLFLLLSFCLTKGFSQLPYIERFNSQSLNTGTYTANSSTQTYYYADAPNGMFTINNGNLIADTLSGNYPFRSIGQKQKAWLTYLPVNGTDTFAVSTSWIKPVGTASAYLITPTISNIAANTVLTWEAMAPDINNADGYEVLVTTNTSTTPLTSNFTTQVFSTTAEKNTWEKHGISLGAFVGQSIRIAFKNNSVNKYQLWLDDIVVENITNGYDAQSLSHENYIYSVINTPNNISAAFKNNGYTPITNLTINYKMDNGTTVSEIKILSPPLNYLESRTLTFAIPYISATAAFNNYKIWTTLINGQTDQFHANDTLLGKLTISSSTPAKKVLLEQYTSTGCGWCPEGYTALNSIATTNTNVIAASIHNNDYMSLTEGSFLTADYANDFPSASIDHAYFAANQTMGIDPADWNTYVNQRLVMKVPATVTITNVVYNSTSNQIDATVSSTFVGDVKGDYRLNLYLKENNVYGPTAITTDNQWNQQSFFYNIGSSPYFQKGTYLNSNTYLLTPSDYKHQYVIDSILDGAYGGSAGIPVNGSTNGITYSKNYSFILPTAASGEFRYNADNIYLIGILSEYDFGIKNKTILNAAEVKLTTNAETLVGIKDYEKTTVQLNIFPNPTSDACNLVYTLNSNEFIKVSVYNALGELVYIETQNMPAGDVVHPLNVSELHSGNYSVQITFKNNSITKKLTIIK